MFWHQRGSCQPWRVYSDGGWLWLEWLPRSDQRLTPNSLALSRLAEFWKASALCSLEGRVVEEKEEKKSAAFKRQPPQRQQQRPLKVPKNRESLACATREAKSWLCGASHFLLLLQNNSPQLHSRLILTHWVLLGPWRMSILSGSAFVQLPASSQAALFFPPERQTPFSVKRFRLNLHEFGLEGWAVGEQKQLHFPSISCKLRHLTSASSRCRCRARLVFSRRSELPAGFRRRRSHVLNDSCARAELRLFTL